MTKYGDDRLRGFDSHANYAREVCMTAGLLCVYGCLSLVSAIYPAVGASVDGQDWSGDEDVYPPVVLLLAALIQVLFSLTSIVVGLQHFVAGAQSTFMSMVSSILVLFSLFTYVVIISYYAFLADKEDYAFIPSFYDSSSAERDALATLGTLGYIAYAGMIFFALVHLNLKLWHLQLGKWSSYSRIFYKGCYAMASFLVLLAGAVQLTLGCYTYDRIGEEKLQSPFAAGLLFHISYPEICIAVGILVLLLGLWMLARSMKKPAGEGGNSGEMMMFHSFTWLVLILSIALQVMTQTIMSNSVFGENGPRGYATQQVALVTGLFLFPIYLDAMYYTTPETIESHHFSSSGHWDKTSGEEHKTETEGSGAAGHVAA